MSATAKALMAFHEKHIGASFGGDVWMPEAMYEKLVELARAELARSKAKPVPMPGAEGSR